ncbi:bifunctional diguanylate cyclase/phosphodiesterase [Paraeggerthella sp. LCP19S3_G8]|uniref:bifunctional diguanylate cyclase/phosphodiesterase n=1 Tax=Paraeggerthella sp. LCP19S3_G8 TaxID=3440248 RepID=UPI003F95E232
MKAILQGSYLRVFAAVFAVVALATGAVCAITLVRGEQVVMEETESYLAELSQQTTYKINQRMSFNVELLEHLGRQLSVIDGDDESRAALTETLVDGGPFSWVGYADRSGTLTVPGAGAVDAQGFRVVMDAIGGQAGVEGDLVEVPEFSPGKGALYAVPAVGPNGLGAVVGWVAHDSMKLLYNTDTADGVGFAHIVSSDGDFILRSENANSLGEDRNFFDGLRNEAVASEDDIARMAQDMQRGMSGCLGYTVDGQLREVNYYPLDLGGWYAISVVPPSLYATSVSDYSTLAIIGTTVLALVSFGAFGGCLAWATSRKNREISRLAFVDPVTGGHTVARFDMLVTERIKDRSPFSLVALDIEDFRLVNDSFGKARGDELLRYLHKAIADGLREGEASARVTADLFNVMLDDTDPELVRAWLHELAERLNAFNRENNAPYFVKLNCGACAVEWPCDIVTIRDRANTARKTSAAAGGHLCRCSFFSDVDHERLIREKEMENEMDRALERGEFILFLQPKICLESGRTIGAEALVRWDSPKRGLLPPGEFIPFFERNGFVIKIDLAVFEQSCKLIRSWIDAGIEPLPLSVNLSPLHLHDDRFLDAFEEIRKRYDVPAELLEFELTESVAFESLDLLRETVLGIHSLGFRCSMDDFGSGYSSLNVLKDIPVDTLKIDRQFFLGDESRSEVVVGSVIDLAKKLNMGTIAEGVETIPQVEFLRSTECDAVQGYVFSAPVPVDLFEKMTFGRTGSTGASDDDGPDRPAR